MPSNFSNLKSQVDNLDDDKLVPVPVDLHKLNDVVKNDVVKKVKYDELVKTTDYNIEINKLERKLLIIIMIDILLINNLMIHSQKVLQQE